MAEHNNLQGWWGSPDLEVVQLAFRRTSILHWRLVPQFECFYCLLGFFQRNLPLKICFASLCKLFCSQWIHTLYGEARRPPTGARCAVAVCGRSASLKRLSACGAPCRNFSNFILMAKARRVLFAACFCGLFIGLKGVAVAAAALILATDCTTVQEILK